jgi:hypothetical protein
MVEQRAERMAEQRAGESAAGLVDSRVDWMAGKTVGQKAVRWAGQWVARMAD